MHTYMHTHTHMTHIRWTYMRVHMRNEIQCMCECVHYIIMVEFFDFKAEHC
jgi:hypothetical protein